MIFQKAGRLAGLEHALDALRASPVDAHQDHLGAAAFKLWEYEPDMVVAVDGQNGFFSTFKGLNIWERDTYLTLDMARNLNERSVRFTVYVGLRF